MVAGAAWSAAHAVTARGGGRRFERFPAVVEAVLIVAAASGLILLVVGEAPADGLHLLYAAVAIAIVPLARSFLGQASTRSAAGFLAVAFAVLGALVWRLFTTG